MASQIQLRRGTIAEWAAANPMLLEGERAFVTDLRLFKTGDGSTAFNSLAWDPRSSFANAKTVTNANDTVLDNDGYEVWRFSTGASDRTLTLPTAAANAGREIELRKTDSGAGKAILDGEGTEKIGVEG